MRTKQSLLLFSAFIVVLLHHSCPPGIAAFHQAANNPRSFSLLKSPHSNQRSCLHALDPDKRFVPSDLVQEEDVTAFAKNEDEEPTTMGGGDVTEGSSKTTVEQLIVSGTNNNAIQQQQNADTDWIRGVAWRGVVAILCALWASNFVAAKLITAEPGVDFTLYALSRFVVAAVALVPFAISAVRRASIDAETARGAAICGSWVALGYLGQTLGLLTTTASRSCVICSLHCVFVAIVAEVWRVSRTQSAGKQTEFDTKRLVPAALSVVGVAIVEMQGAVGGPSMGDLISFAQPIGFGMGYLQLEKLMSRRPDMALPVSAIKLLIVALASLLLFEVTPLFTTTGGEMWIPQIPDFGAILSSPLAIGGILYTGLVTTALALWVESMAFARVPATDASIILTTEPLFAAGFGAIYLGETFSMSDYTGASLIVGACVLASLLDNPGDEECIIEEDPSCEPPRKWPFWGF